MTVAGRKTFTAPVSVVRGCGEWLSDRYDGKAWYGRLPRSRQRRGTILGGPDQSEVYFALDMLWASFIGGKLLHLSARKRLVRDGEMRVTLNRDELRWLAETLPTHALPKHENGRADAARFGIIANRISNRKRGHPPLDREALRKRLSGPWAGSIDSENFARQTKRWRANRRKIDRAAAARSAGRFGRWVPASGGSTIIGAKTP